MQCAENWLELTLVSQGRKSQIATEYCYRFREGHPDARVFWVHASTTSRFKQAYKTIAHDLGLFKKDDTEANTLWRVTDWLNDEDNGRWLMILDIADDQAVSESRPQITEAFDHSTPLVRYLPSNHHYKRQTHRGEIDIRREAIHGILI